MPYFSRRTQLDKHLGDKFRFEAVEFGNEAPTMKEAIEMTEKDMADYIAEKKNQLKKKDLEEIPFESKNPNRK